MDYKTLAISIASAEDPYGEFAKEASDLDEVHKTTLAREVNKQMFISRLDGREGDGHIDFDVIEPELKDTHVTKSVGDPTVEKVASEQPSKSPLEKRAMVEDSMFVVAPRQTIKAKSTTGGSAKTFRKIAEHIIDDDLDRISDKEKQAFDETKVRAVALLNDMFGAELEGITKMADDASELRSVIGAAIGKGLSNVVPEIVAISNDAESTLLKVASVDLDDTRAKAVDASLDYMVNLNEAKALVKQASTQQELDKLAFIAPLLGGIARLGFNVAKGAAKGGRALGKGAWGTMKLPGRVTGATKNLLTLKNPAKGWKDGGGLMTTLGTTAVLGGAALTAGPTMDKYQEMTQRI